VWRSTFRASAGVRLRSIELSAGCAGRGEEAGHVENHLRLREVEGDVSERFDQVADRRVGVGLVGDRGDGQAPAVGVGLRLLHLLGADPDLRRLREVALDFDEVVDAGLGIDREHVEARIAVVLALRIAAELPLDRHDGLDRSTVGLHLVGRLVRLWRLPMEQVEEALRDDEGCAHDGGRAVVEVGLEIELEQATVAAGRELIGSGARSAGVECGLFAGQLLGLQLLGALVPVADLGLQPLAHCSPHLGHPGAGDGVELLEVRAGQVLDGPVTRPRLGGRPDPLAGCLDVD